MDTMEDNCDNLWAELDSEFENTDAVPVKLDLSERPARRRTFMVSVRQSMFSGFYPMLALCLVAAAASVRDWSTGLLFGLSALLAFPLAGILAPLFRDPKKRWWFYAGVAVLAGGVTELTTTASDVLVASQTDIYFSSFDTMSVFQKHLENFYSLSHWGLYIVLGVVLAGLTYTYKKRVPWMDNPPRSRVLTLLGSCLLLLPLLVPPALSLVGEVHFRESLDWLSEVEASTESLPTPRYNPKDSQLWREAHQRWMNSLSRDSGITEDDRIQNSSASDIRRLEEQFLKLSREADSARPDLWQRQRICAALLTRTSDLARPSEVALEAVELHFLNRIGTTREFHCGVALEQLLAELCEARGRADLESWRKEVRELNGHLMTPVDEMDLAVYSMVREEFRPEEWRAKLEPLELFGHDFEHSPTRLWFRREGVQLLGPWLELRRTLSGLSGDDQLYQLRAAGESGPWSRLFRNLGYRTYSSEIRPLLQASEVLIASRLHKIDTGEWPTSVEALKGQLSFPIQANRWEFQLDADSLTISDRELAESIWHSPLYFPQDRRPSTTDITSQWVLR